MCGAKIAAGLAALGTAEQAMATKWEAEPNTNVPIHNINCALFTFFVTFVAFCSKFELSPYPF